MMTVIFTFEDLNDAFTGCDEDIITFFETGENLIYFHQSIIF